MSANPQEPTGLEIKVVITDPDGNTRSETVRKNEVTIGRVKANDVVLPDGKVSQRHARIVFNQGRLVLVDLKSTNGTYLNGRKLSSPTIVSATDTIHMGGFSFSARVMEGIPTGALPPPPPLQEDARGPMAPPDYPTADPAAMTAPPYVPEPAPPPQAYEQRRHLTPIPGGQNAGGQNAGGQNAGGQNAGGQHLGGQHLGGQSPGGLPTPHAAGPGQDRYSAERPLPAPASSRALWHQLVVAAVSAGKDADAAAALAWRVLELEPQWDGDSAKRRAGSPP